MREKTTSEPEKRKRTSSTSSNNDTSGISKNSTKDKNPVSSSASKKIDSNHHSKASKLVDNEKTELQVEEQKSATTKKNGATLQQPGETSDPPELKIVQIATKMDDHSASARPDSKSRQIILKFKVYFSRFSQF